jgi:hypothetical protein
MAEPMPILAGIGPWKLAALADPAVFERHYETVTAAVAERITARIHLNGLAMRAAFDDFTGSFESIDSGSVARGHFVDICARLIASLAGRRIVAYSTVARARPDPMVETVVKYPNEITALASGAAVYLLRVRDLTGVDPSLPLSALVMENAAALLRRNVRAATRFRELLRLTTPWNDAVI